MKFDLVHIWENMTILNKVIIVMLLLMSVYTFYVIAVRLLAFRSAGEQSIRYVQVLGEHLRQHRIDEALRAAKIANKSPVAKVMDAGLTALQQGREALVKEGPHDVGNFDLVDSVNRALERSKERETANLRTGLGWLGTAASATPFIGLLGTVVGIMAALYTLAGDPSIQKIAPAISEALIATAVGLGVAIIAAMAFNFFTARVEAFVVDMDDVASEFIDYVLREGRP
jgi:biopolymer transport protein ExbB/TolQ